LGNVPVKPFFGEEYDAFFVIEPTNEVTDRQKRYNADNGKDMLPTKTRNMGWRKTILVPF